MALLLRIDVDKPYGHHNPLVKLASKLSEDYEWSFGHWLPYLHHCHAMIRWLTEQQVPAFFYFRSCTAPLPATLQLLQEGGHHMGFHAENTRSQASFSAEWAAFQQRIGQPVTHFTKHGSGKLKLGRHHYAPYEPERYQAWATALGIRYFSGNGMAATPGDLTAVDGFWPNCFWMERHYRLPGCNSLDQLVAAAEAQDVVVITHPENFFTHPVLRQDLHQLIQSASTRRIPWQHQIPQ